MTKASEIYNEGYFHGINSGYPKEGYEKSHPDWSVHLDCISGAVPAGARVLDIGCAYGYFVEQAIARGYDACGIDISDYAVTRKPELSKRLVRAGADSLPHEPASFDLVTAFDLLQHLPDPVSALKEFKRVLKPSGFLLFSTPDPLKFTEKYEETHINERPPSYWIKILTDLGFDYRFWFYDTLSLEAIACPSPTCKDALDEIHRAFLSRRYPAVDDIQGSEGVSLTVRGCWDEDAGTSAGKPRSLYLLNRTGAGISCRVRTTTQGISGLTLSCTSPLVTVLNEKRSPGVDGSGDSADWLVHCPPMGFELSISGANGIKPRLKKASVQDVRPWNMDFTGLAGDHLSRHRTAISYLKGLRLPSGARILDLGGGDSLMALLAPEYDWTVVDLFGADHPSFVRRRLNDQFGDGRTYDAVVSVDVLEHVPADERELFLSRACARTHGPVVLAAPFDSPSIRTAESLFAQAMTQLSEEGHKFIEDHVKLGLPALERVLAFLRNLKGKCAILPGESVHFWWQSTLYYLTLRELFPSMDLASLFSRHQNEAGLSSIGTPCYRHYIVAWDDLQVERLSSETTSCPSQELAIEQIVEYCLKMASLGSLYQTKRNLELRSALQASQAEATRLMAEWQKLFANYNQAVAERDGYHAKYRRLRDFLVTLYQMIPLKWFMPLGPIDPKSGEFRLK
jgi:SAM-dependent methyltransferase